MTITLPQIWSTLASIFSHIHSNRKTKQISKDWKKEIDIKNNFQSPATSNHPRFSSTPEGQKNEFLFNILKYIECTNKE